MSQTTTPAAAIETGVKAAEFADWYALQVDAAAKALNFARERLAAEVTSGRNAVSLADYLNNLAEAEGAVSVWGGIDTAERIAAGLRDGSITIVNVITYTSRPAMNGASDTWSGRTNDARRAHHDGARKAAAEILDRGLHAL